MHGFGLYDEPEGVERREAESSSPNSTAICSNHNNTIVDDDFLPILKNDEDHDCWLDNETDELLNSILNGNESLLDVDAVSFKSEKDEDDIDCIVDPGNYLFDKELLSPAGSASSVASTNNSIDLKDYISNGDRDDESNLQAVNPMTISPDPPVMPTSLVVSSTKMMVKAVNTSSPIKVNTIKSKQNNNNNNNNTVASSKSSNVIPSALLVNMATPTDKSQTVSLVSKPNNGNSSSPIANAVLSFVNNIAKSCVIGGRPNILSTDSSKGSSSHHQQQQLPASKRRRVSASSSDSGLEDAASSSGSSAVSYRPCRSSTVNGSRSVVASTVSPVISSAPGASLCKYPRLELTSEEKKLCEKEGVVLPSRYPLTKVEEANLKRIRRKIRNKLSAQDSRKRKKEYVDSMEERAIKCAEENSDLQKKVAMLEKQNKTLVGQLRRLHQIIVNRGGLASANAADNIVTGGGSGGSNNQNYRSPGGQASTALMVLLLSAALFLIPGMKEQYDTKPRLEMSEALKGPPLPERSRSLLHFAPPRQAITQKEDYSTASASSDQLGSNSTRCGERTAKQGRMAANTSVVDYDARRTQSPFGDHDYVGGSGKRSASTSTSSKRTSEVMRKTYIDADVPPLGYGENAKSDKIEFSGGLNEFSVEKEAGSDRMLNVSVMTSGTRRRTVLLHVPKDIM